MIKNKDRKLKNNRLDAAGMAILVGLCASWGLAQVAIKIANHGVPPVMQASVRSIGAAIFVLIWMKIRKNPVMKKDKTLLWGIIAGLLFSIEFILIYWGLNFTNASRAVIFLYMSPFVVAIGAQIFVPEESLGKIQIFGLCFAFIGIIAAFSESFSLLGNRVLIGDIMLVSAAVFWGYTTVLIKATPLSLIAPGKILLYQLAVSAIVLPAASFAMGEASIHYLDLSPLIIACIVYQIVWIAFVTYFVWFWLIANYSISRLASFTFLTPLFGVLAGNIFLNEPITSKLLFSLIFVGTGIYLVNRRN